jgi:pimeloyl-ACP methyl ester carboxylesterase
MPIAAINGTKINYMQLSYKGEGETEDLVMVHGLAANMAFWLQDYAKYFSQFFRVTLYDLHGHGRSEITDSGYKVRDMSNDLEDLLKHLEIKKAHFIAHSFGGAITLNIACSKPELFESLVLADTHISAGRQLEKEAGWENKNAVAEVLQQCNIHLDINDPHFGYNLLTEVARLRVNGNEIPRNLFPWVEWIFGGNNKRPAEKWLQLIDNTAAKNELTADDKLSAERLVKINFPLLLMYGEKSQSMATGKFIAELLPDVEFAVVKNGGHFFPRAYPDLVKSLCDDFYLKQNEKIKVRAVA